MRGIKLVQKIEDCATSGKSIVLNLIEIKQPVLGNLTLGRTGERGVTQELRWSRMDILDWNDYRRKLSVGIRHT